MQTDKKQVRRAKFLNLKLPLGGLLIFYGIVLVCYGAATDQSFYQKSLGIDINLLWGFVILAVGLVLLGMYFLFDRKQSLTEADQEAQNNDQADI